MLINLTNHPSNNWPERQNKFAIADYKEIYDLPFPNINPNDTEKQITETALIYLVEIQKILDHFPNQNNAVHIQGEFNFVFTLVSMLKAKNIKCIASTSNRNVIMQNGKKIADFEFVKFREYKTN